MRVVFIGAVEFSLHALKCLIDLGVDVAGVCTTKESKFNADHVDLSGVCLENNLPCFISSNINDSDAVAWISKKKPDVIFCFGWSRLLKKEILEMPPMGVVGFHPAALPANRGRHPLVWALVLGLKETASTFFFMKEGADDGDILSQCKIPISEDDDARTLYDKMTNSALLQIQEFVPALDVGYFDRRSQDGLPFNTWRKRARPDGQIDWRMSARSIHNLVRGLTKPYVGAHFINNSEEIKVWKTKVIDGVDENLEPGKIVAYQNGCPVLKCGEGAICLLVTEPKIELGLGGYL
jgi:methionyl-tRNA formyltransferase